MTQLHIVDELIYERAPGLVASPMWPLLKPCLYGLLGYQKAVNMANAIASMGGQESLDYVSRLLSLTVTASHLERIPVHGRCLIVCNHPTGIADGVAVADAISRVRSDIVFFANADALRVCPRLSESLIPVEWVDSKRTREKTRATLAAARLAFDSERCIVMFPAGRLARRNRMGQLIDPPWAPTAISLAQKYKAPVLPIHIEGPNSFWFHAFNSVSRELRDITLFHELLNKAGKRFELSVGQAIDLSLPEFSSCETSDLCDALKSYVELAINARQDPVFKMVS